VTFLFTDIEGSIGLWQADETAMRAALSRHVLPVDRSALDLQVVRYSALMFCSESGRCCTARRVDTVQAQADPLLHNLVIIADPLAARHPSCQGCGQDLLPEALWP